MNCVTPGPANQTTNKLNQLLANGGANYTLRLCPGMRYSLTSQLNFAAPGQEISTAGYPRNSNRAVLIVNGPRDFTAKTGHTTAISGNCGQCGGIKLRNVIINGNRGNNNATIGGANVEMGGATSGQLVEYVKSYDPRGWSCLHIIEGGLQCSGAIVRNNDIGPCGSSNYQQWSDGISFACANSQVHDNTITDPTDGGIVLFGSPGSNVYNNVIQVQKTVALGGINMVDYDPWGGDYINLTVHDNTLIGGFADPPVTGTTGKDKYNAVIKIGIAIGPRTWFGSLFTTVNNGTGAVIYNNRFTGAFSYGMAVSGATGFTVKGNVLYGNTAFIGKIGPNCSNSATGAATAPFVFDSTLTSNLDLEDPYTKVNDASGLVCVQPPIGGSWWPYGGRPARSPTKPLRRHVQILQTTETLDSGMIASRSDQAIGIVAVLALLSLCASALILRWLAVCSREANNRPVKV